jgi:glycosyltransferase involved in cell wall biosynthesis
VLILADDCNPEWPSLPIVGYKAALAIADHADVVVATHVRNRQNIEKVGFGRAAVRYVDNEYVARNLFRLSKFIRGGTATGWSTGMALAYPSYLAFEWEAWKLTRDELHRGEFDLVHRLTPMSPTLPSPMASWSPVPFILGPLNGGLKWPSEFRQELLREREWLSKLRFIYRALPYARSTYRNATAILNAFRHTLDDLPRDVIPRTVDFPEIGIDPLIFALPSEKPQGTRKTILFVGRFVPYKLPLVVVQAYADEPDLHRHKLIMVGDGPERRSIEDLIRVRGLESHIELVGWKTQKETAEIMRHAHIFAFPSIRELGAGVVVEAMANGLACVVVDYGAPGTLVDNSRGTKVPLSNRKALTKSFGNALVRIANEEGMADRLGASAREYAMSFYTWDAKARKTVSVYEWVLGQRSKPDFWSENNE